MGLSGVRYNSTMWQRALSRLIQYAKPNQQEKNHVQSQSLFRSQRDIAADHDINAYINLLGRDGNLTLVGAPDKPLAVSAFSLILGRRSLSGSPIGGIAETQEMLDFCGEHNITADVEVIRSRR